MNLENLNYHQWYRGTYQGYKLYAYDPMRIVRIRYLKKLSKKKRRQGVKRDSSIWIQILKDGQMYIVHNESILMNSKMCRTVQEAIDDL